MASVIRSRRSTRPRGQAIAEFAISAIVLLLLLLAILQFAFLYNAQIGVANGVRDTARYASQLVANDDTSAAIASSRGRTFLGTAMGTYVTPYSATNLASGSEVCFEPYMDAANVAAVRVRVTAVYRHPLVVPLVSLILDGFDGSLDNAYSMSSVLEMRVDNPSEPVPSLTGASCT